MRELYLVSYVFFIFISPAAGHISGLYPDHFSSYFYNPATINPAYIAKDGNSEAILQSKLRSGIYSDIYSFGASVQKTFENRKDQWHSGRLLLSNEKEGIYISTPRFYGNYSIRIPLAGKTDILAGISLGLVNPSIKVPTRALSSLLPDGAIGLMIRHGNSSAGISSSHLFNTSADNLKLSRYYSAHLSTFATLSSELTLKAYFIWKYFGMMPSQADGALSILLSEKLEAGTGYRYRRGVFIFCSFTIDPASVHPLTFGALYNSPFMDKARALGDSFELNLVYKY